MTAPPMYLDAVPDLRRHLSKPVFTETKILRKALCAVRKATSASTQFLPEHGLTVGEFCACRLIKKWQVAEEEGDAKRGGDVH